MYYRVIISSSQQAYENKWNFLFYRSIVQYENDTKVGPTNKYSNT
jgi:hypothetical protein